MSLPERVEWASMTPLHWLVVGLATVTGLVHLALGLGSLPAPLGVAALGAAAGFAVGIWLVLHNRYRRVVYAIGIPFTLAQIVLWYVLNEPASLAEVTPLAAVDKVVQSSLIVALVVLLNRER